MREPWERYLNDVVSHVRFAFDRRKIRQELREHMEDLYEDLLSQDIDEKQAAELTVDYMGDSEELGKELDKAHHPVLGDVWLILGILCIVVAAKTAFGLLDTGIGIAKGILRKCIRLLPAKWYIPFLLMWKNRFTIIPCTSIKLCTTRTAGWKWIMPHGEILFPEMNIGLLKSVPFLMWEKHSATMGKEVIKMDVIMEKVKSS